MNLTVKYRNKFWRLGAEGWSEVGGPPATPEIVTAIEKWCKARPEAKRFLTNYGHFRGMQAWQRDKLTRAIARFRGRPWGPEEWRKTRCWYCGEDLDTAKDAECERCAWLVCSACTACICGIPE